LLIAETSCERRNEFLDRAFGGANGEGLGAVVAKVEFHCGELFPPRGLHRQQFRDFKPGGGAVLQQAWDSRAMHQRK
jgi:hypothetical protein